MSWRDFGQAVMLFIMGGAIVAAAFLAAARYTPYAPVINAEPGATVLINPYYVTSDAPPIIMDTRGQTVRSLPDPKEGKK